MTEWSERRSRLAGAAITVVAYRAERGEWRVDSITVETDAWSTTHSTQLGLDGGKLRVSLLLPDHERT